MKKLMTAFLCFGVLLTTTPHATHADAIVGESIYTLGEDLKQEQKDALLKEMEYTEGETIITVTNKEEHTYLGGIIPTAQIGTKAYSSSKITMKEKQSGIVVVTQNINWVTPEMYTNALITAGVKDAEVYVTAPFKVSGTAALTGLMKAYELSTGEKIDDETKKIANEEMVTTAELGEKIGEDKANSLVTNIKQEIAKEEPKNEEQIEEIVTDVSNKMEVTLDPQTLAQLTALFNKMNEAGINWDQIQEQIDIAKKEWGDKFEEISQGFFQKIYDMFEGFFQKVWDFIMNIVDQIKGSTSTEEQTPSIDNPEQSNTNEENTVETPEDTPSVNEEVKTEPSDTVDSNTDEQPNTENSTESENNLSQPSDTNESPSSSTETNENTNEEINQNDSSDTSSQQ